MSAWSNHLDGAVALLTVRGMAPSKASLRIFFQLRGQIVKLSFQTLAKSNITTADQLPSKEFAYP